MPTPQRLPIVNSDDAVWGDILRQFLMKEHFNDDTNNAANGGHQTITVKAGTTAAGTAPIKLSSGTRMTAAEVGAMEFDTDMLYFTVSTGTTRKNVALYDDASGATGDIYYRNSSGIFTRLAVGANGKILKVASGLPAWGDAGTGTVATATKTSNYTIVSGTDVVILANAASGNVTITLPTASSSAGYKFDIKRIDSTGNTCNIVPAGTDTIDGQSSGTPTVLAVQYFSVTIVSDGSNWYII